MAEPSFVAPQSVALRIVPLDGLTAIYHRPSGQTHIVTEPVPEILAALADAKTAPELMVALGVDDRPALEARLEELLITGLIARA